MKLVEIDEHDEKTMSSVLFITRMETNQMIWERERENWEDEWGEREDLMWAEMT